MHTESIASVRIALIAVGTRLRPLNETVVADLAESIRLIGQRDPIHVTEDLDLVDGYHRLEACRRAGKAEVMAIIRPYTGDEAQLAECDANLMKSALTALERMQHLEVRKAIRERMVRVNRPTVKAYEPDEQQAQTVPGRNVFAPSEDTQSEEPVAGSIASFDPDEEYVFTREEAARTGLSQRTIQQDLQTAFGLADDVETLVADTAIANSRRELAALAALPAARQRAVAEQALAEGVTVQSLTAARSPKIARTKAKAAAIRITDSDRVLKARPALAAATSCGCLCPECRDRMKRALA